MKSAIEAAAEGYNGSVRRNVSLKMAKIW